MPKPVYLMTVQEARKEYNSLMDKIRAKYEQLDSGERTLHKTEPANSKGIVQAHILQAHLKTLFGSKFCTGRQFVRVWRMQICSHRYVRITRLLSAI